MAQLSEIPDLIENGWTTRCPKGHVDIRDKQGSTVNCRSCGGICGYPGAMSVLESVEFVTESIQ